MKKPHAFVPVLLILFVMSAMSILAATPDGCASVAGLDDLLAPGRILLLGEMHGTEQSPGFAFSVACAAAASGHATIVGLELAADAQPMVDRYLESDGTSADREALLEHSMWQRSYQDGRNSRAMVDLIEHVRAIRAGGRSVGVLFFDAHGAGGGQQRDRRMAARLAESAKAHPEAVHVVLTGNIHSRIAPGIARNRDFEPMGYALKKAVDPERVLAFNVAYADGTAWVCSLGCGVVGLAGHSTGPRWSFEKDEATRPSGHHGWYHVGAVTASLPAVGDHELPEESAVTTVEASPAEETRKSAAADSPAVAKLQGKWQSWQNGLRSWWIEFDGRDFYGEIGPDDWYRGKIFVRPDDPHSEIDFLIEDCVCGYKGSSSDGIYRWEGDQVRLAAPNPGNARPTYFDGQKGDAVVLRKIETESAN